MFNKEKKTKLPIIRYMVYILIVTITVTGTSLSRYSVTESTNATARVAKFDVQVECTSDENMNNLYKSELKLGGNGNYKYSITNNSEVSVKGELVTQSSNVSLSVENDDFILSVGETKEVSVSVSGSGIGNVSFYFEFTQID